MASGEKKVTILIAEDEEDLREMYVMALSGAGFEVLEAKNGKEALEFLAREHEKISMVLLDIVMPEMDGFETLEKMKKIEAYENIPVIISTNLDNDEDKSYAFSLGVKEYFVKSMHTPKDLIAIIREKLEKVAK
jgi:CheY-like chemotaxis protein